MESGTPRAQVAIGLGSFEELIMPLLDEPLPAHGCATGWPPVASWVPVIEQR